jgi:predicted AAA+ superfamily ATPase
MCDKWLNKYEPNNLDDFNNFKNNEIKIIQDFILNYKSKPFPNIIISGLHGVGKSILIKLIIKL